MVFTRKDGDFHGRTVSFRESNPLLRKDPVQTPPNLPQQTIYLRLCRQSQALLIITQAIPARFPKWTVHGMPCGKMSHYTGWLIGILIMVYYNPYMGVSKNRGITKSSILIGFSIINHPFWSTIIFGNTHITG